MVANAFSGINIDHMLIFKYPQNFFYILKCCVNFINTLYSVCIASQSFVCSKIIGHFLYIDELRSIGGAAWNNIFKSELNKFNLSEIESHINETSFQNIFIYGNFIALYIVHSYLHKVITSSHALLHNTMYKNILLILKSVLIMHHNIIMFEQDEILKWYIYMYIISISDLFPCNIICIIDSFCFQNLRNFSKIISIRIILYFIENFSNFDAFLQISMFYLFNTVSRTKIHYNSYLFEGNKYYG